MGTTRHGDAGRIKQPSPGLALPGCAKLGVGCQCTQVLFLTCHTAPQAARPSGLGRGLPEPGLQKVRAYVQTHLAEAIDSNAVAAEVGLSRSYFERQFKLAAGLTLHDYIIRQRVAAAAALIADEDLPLKLVAGRVGLADQSHLTRLIKRHRGVTPKALRQQARAASRLAARPPDGKG